ncbi:glycosyltransferase family 2 protein [Gammaproteobacteria bacterium]|nr:glycosyltransferase family 2 protein [Gammaproteobacteria bacterium]
MEKKYKISVITPCFNEGLEVKNCYLAVKKIFDTDLIKYDLEHIFCDNSSTDDTIDHLKAIAASDPSVKLILNSRNFGILANTYNGVMASDGDAVIMFMPVDLQDPPELIPNFVKYWEEGYEIIYGIRQERQENFFLRNFRHLCYRLISIFSYIDYPPDVGDFQLVDKMIINHMRKLEDNRPFLRMLPFEIGGKKIGVPYKWETRISRKSKNSFYQLIDQGLTGFIAFSVAPLRICLISGLFIGFFSFLYLMYIFIGTISGLLINEQGIPTIIIAIFFFGGVNLFFLGMVGEYILSIFFNARKSPVVFERERINFKKDL